MLILLSLVSLSMEAVQMTAKVTVTFLLFVSVASLIGYILIRTVDVDITWNTDLNVSKSDPVKITDSADHIFVFSQISDLHLSVNFDPTRGPDLYRFCTEVIDVIEPTVVLATGDLTDSRVGLAFGSHQIREEWEMYHDILMRSNVTKKTTWIDIRGNHDNFNVNGWNDSKNFYKKYSMSGSAGHSSHFATVVKSSSSSVSSSTSDVSKSVDTFAFIGVDACLHPGPKRPFNFIGVLHEEDIHAIEVLRRSVGSQNMTFWFGHYPTSAIAEPVSKGIRDVIDGFYFCGHLHINNFYASQSSGFMELELSDWRAKRTFRVMAVDHGLFSFTDVVLDQWPIVLITNPKASQFVMPSIEPFHRIASSSHIRTLVWSNVSIVSVKYQIDHSDWVEMKPVSGTPLYVSTWDPEKYQTGLHTIKVKAIDSKKQSTESFHSFSIDGSKDEFRAFSRFGLRFPIRSFFAIIYSLAILCSVLPLVFLRILDYRKRGRTLKNPLKGPFMKLFSKFFVSACVNKIFWPLIGIPLYSTCGPWLIGHIVDDHYGICFVWGIFVYGVRNDSGATFLPGGFTYITAVIFLLFIHTPSSFCIAWSVHRRYRHLTDGRRITSCEPILALRNVPMLIVLAAHLYWSHIFTTSYGFIAWITGFLFTWTWLIYLILWIASQRLRIEDFSTNCIPRIPIVPTPVEGNENSQLID